MKAEVSGGNIPVQLNENEPSGKNIGRPNRTPLVFFYSPPGPSLRGLLDSGSGSVDSFGRSISGILPSS